MALPVCWSKLVGGPTSQLGVGLKANAVLGDEKEFGKIAAAWPAQLVINVALS